jgi:hypothetical protein
MARAASWSWLLPLAWALVLAGGRVHRGDEYGMYLLASAPAWPLAFALAGVAEGMGMWAGSFLCGLLWILPLGWTMDRARVRLLPWLLLWTVVASVVAALLVTQHPSLERAIRKNGSLWAYAFAGLGLTLVPVAFLALFLPRLRAARAGQPGAQSSMVHRDAPSSAGG